MNAPAMVKKERERERKPEQTCPPLPSFVRENISQEQRVTAMRKEAIKVKGNRRSMYLGINKFYDEEVRKDRSSDREKPLLENFRS